MQEKLGVAMVISTSLTVITLLFSLVFPQPVNVEAGITDFSKGLGAALLCCCVGLIAVFKYNKYGCSEKK